jgi:hypothetical protein
MTGRPDAMRGDGIDEQRRREWSMTELEWVISNGGPILAIPCELAVHWRGTSPPMGVEVPAGWTWGDGGVVCDYDRACDDMEDSVLVGDSASTWSVPVAGGRALVMDGEMSTAAVAWEDGLVLLRYADVTTVDEGAAIAAEIEADGGVLDVPIAPGRYRAWYATGIDPADRLTLIRLSRRGD